MCGILFTIAHNGSSLEHAELTSRLKPLLSGRGPDSQRSIQDELNLSAGRFSLNWYSTVLSLRGQGVVAQPLVDDDSGSNLCWNGEAWSIAGDAISGNDAKAVFDLLLQAISRTGSENTDASVIRMLMSICGPYAFVFYDAVHAHVYFGRDALGRRSLLIKPGESSLAISSVGDGTPGWSEVPADGIYAIDLDLDFDGSVCTAPDKFSERALPVPTSQYAYKNYGKPSTFNHALPPHVVPVLDQHDPAVAELESLLRDALAVRTRSIPYLTADACEVDAHVSCSLAALADSSQHEARHVIKVHGGPHSETAGPRVAVLFSGGLDCTVLARLLHDTLALGEEVDLLNVAFHNPRSHGAVTADSDTAFELCPDRITAKSSHAELMRVCPGRKWRLVRINVSYTEMMEHRKQVASLMYPHDTEMDMSIALALYFAARGVGASSEHSDDRSTEYTTPARVLFSGLGADELFGGYQRHSTAYSRQGFKGLLEELELDINRLGQRNLGRDDRVISHWSKEARYPFLDEALVHWAVTAPVWNKCGFGQSTSSKCKEEHHLPEVEPGKQVLRLVALKLGIVKAAQEKKRAIQFGARTAKMQPGGGKVKGTQTIS